MPHQIVENEEYEKGINQFFQKNLEKTYEEMEAIRHSYLRIFQSRKLIAIFLCAFFILISIVEIFDLGNVRILSQLHNGYDFINSSYNGWYVNRHNFLQFILPSRVIFLPFPSPEIFLIFAMFFTFIWAISPALKYHNRSIAEIKASCLMKFVKFSFQETEENEMNLLENCDINLFYESANLPNYDYINDDEILNFTIDKLLINLFETNLVLEKDIENDRKMNLSTFQGLIFKVSKLAINENEENTHQTSIASSKEKFKNFNMSPLEKTFENDNVLIFDEQKLLPDNIVEIIEKFHPIINKHNLPPNYFLDTRISKFINRDFYLDHKLINENEDSIMNSNLQIILQNEELYIMIPLNRKIFAKRSIVRKYYNEEDIKIFLASLSMLKEIISQKPT